MIYVCFSGYPGYPYPGGNAYPATGGPAHYTSQTPVTTVGELSCFAFGSFRELNYFIYNFNP